MAFSGNDFIPDVYSYEAGADLTGCEGLFVKLDANGNVILVSAVTDRAVGVLRDGNKLGATVGVVSGAGIFPVRVAAGGIAPGDLIGVTAAAKGAKIVAGTDTTKYIHGVAVEASVAADDHISVQLVLPTAKAA